MLWVTGNWRFTCNSERMPGPSQELRIQALARHQHGAVELSQLLTAGLTEGQIRGMRSRGRLTLLLPRVFIVDSAPKTKRLRCMGTVLWAGSGAAIGGRTSAELHGLLAPIAGPIEVTSARNRRSRSGIVHTRRALEPSEVATVDNIPLVSVARTLLDLCAITDAETCEIAVDAALRDGRVLVEQLSDLVERASARRLAGVSVLRQLVVIRGDEEALVESELESRVIRLLKRADYPVPRCQVVMELGDRPGRVDFFYPHASLVIEVDGRRWHAGRREQQRDRRRDHALELKGLRHLRFTWEDVVHRPEYFLAVVGDALGILPVARLV